MQHSYVSCKSVVFLFSEFEKRKKEVFIDTIYTRHAIQNTVWHVNFLILDLLGPN